MGWRYRNNGYSATMRSHVTEICKELNTIVPLGKQEDAVNAIIRDLRSSIKKVELTDFKEKKAVSLFGR